jgi:hypothetical protein
MPDTITASSFIRSLLVKNDFSTESYGKILRSIPYTYPSLSFSSLTDEKVQLLINSNTISMTEENFAVAKENFHNLHIKLIEKNPATFIAKIAEFEIDNSDILSLLKSTVLTSDIKEKLINTLEVSTITEDSELLVEVGNIFLEKGRLKIDKVIARSILLKSSLSTIEKIRLFTMESELLDKDEVFEMISSFEEPYQNISLKGKMPLIERNVYTEQFVEILKTKEYISNFKVKKAGIRVSTFKK